MARVEKTALVLSAGGMFGAWQAGVWQALEAHFRPDIIVGASAGSLNGWLIASGYSGTDLARRWCSLEQTAQIRWRMPRSLADGVLDATLLEELIRDVCGAAQPSVDFGIVLTDTRRLKPVLFRHPEISWRHVAASCAVPLFLPHHRIDGVWYSDGGVLDPLPLWAAIEMGATRIVGVNCLKTQRTWLTWGAEAVRRWANYRRPDTQQMSFVEIVPGASLGSARDCMYWTRQNAERWIELGKQDGESALTSVVECGNRVRPDGGPAESDEGCTHTEFTV